MNFNQIRANSPDWGIDLKINVDIYINDINPIEFFLNL